MSTILPAKNDCPPLVYEEHCLLMAWMDAHWTRSDNPAGAFREAYLNFEKACSIERGDIEKNYGVIAHQSGLGFPTLAPELFKPTSYLALGQSDVLAMTLLDDLDGTQLLMAQTNQTIEEATLAFCLKPALLHEKHPKLIENLVRVRDLFTPENETQRPLLMLVRLKLEGLPLLLDPITVQSCVLDVACQKMTEAWEALKAAGASELFAISDLRDDAWRVALLDLQEEEEIGLLFSSRNLSLPAVFLSALRGLTLGKLCKQSETFDELMRTVGTPLLDKIASASETAPQGAVSAADCHVFRWSRSSVALHLDAYEALEQNSPERVVLTGLAATVTATQVPAGHNGKAAELALRSLWDGSAQESGPWRACMLGSVDMLIGTAITKVFNEKCWLPADRYAPVEEVFHSLARLCAKMKQDRKGSASRHVSGWATAVIVPVPVNLKDGEGAPVDTSYLPIGGSHYPYLGSFIKEVTECMFHGNGNADESLVTRLRDAMQLSGLPVTLRRAFMVLFGKYVSLARHPMRYDAVFDIYDSMQTLWQVLTEQLPALLKPEQDSKHSALVPRLATRKVKFLFDFASAIESSIELRLRRSFPDGPEQEWDLDFRGPMSQVVIAGETVLRSAIGIVRRSVLGERDSFKRLGVVNRMSVSGGIYHEIGGLGFENQARITFVDTDVAHLTHLTQLADYFHEAFHLIHEEMIMVDSSPPPDTTVSKLGSHLAANVRGCIAHQIADNTGDELTELVDEYTAETFVAMMMFLSVADMTADLLWAHQGVTFASSPASAYQPATAPRQTYTESRRDLHLRYAKAFIPLGMISALLKPLEDEATANGIPLLDHLVDFLRQGRRLELLPVSQARAIFIERCKQVSRLLPEEFPVKVEDHPLPQGLNYWHPDVLQEFDRIWTRMAANELLSTMWQTALEVFTCFAADVADAAGRTPLEQSQTDDALTLRLHELPEFWRIESERIDQMLIKRNDEEGKPVSVKEIFEAWFLRCNSADDRQCEPPPATGTMFVMRALHWAWEKYLPKLQLPGTTEWRLPRKVVWTNDEACVKIDWGPQGAVDYADYMVDSIRPDGFSVRPEARAQRLRDQAVFMKSLWGISAVIRRRRLMAMITAHKEFKAVKPKQP